MIHRLRLCRIVLNALLWMALPLKARIAIKVESDPTLWLERVVLLRIGGSEYLLLTPEGDIEREDLALPPVLSWRLIKGNRTVPGVRTENLFLTEISRGQDWTNDEIKELLDEARTMGRALGVQDVDDDGGVEPLREALKTGLGISGKVASGVSAPMMHRPLCGCRCGCRRRPGRLVLCVRCGARIGPGCCLALESRTRWGRGLCHVCADGEPEHVIGVCVAEHTTTPVLGPEVAQMVSTTALAAAAPAAQSMGEQSMAQGLNADIVARSIERSIEAAVLAAQTAVPVPVSAPSPPPSWTTAWTMPSWVIFGFGLFVNSRRGVVLTP